MNLQSLKTSTAVVLFALLFTFRSFGQSNGFELLKNQELMDMIFQQLEMYYVDDISVGEMSKTAIDAMLRDLDPYTVYYHESNIEDYKLMTTGQYGGVGALIRKIDDYVYFAEPYEGNPALKAGVRAGDKILSIEGISMKNKAIDEVSNALQGPKGSTILVKIERDGKEVPLSIVRDEIKLPDVPFSGMITSEIGYIKLNSFTQTAAADVRAAYDKLVAKGMKSLVIDLRGNGGGLLVEAIKIVNMFVKRGQTVVTTKGRIKEENRDYKTTDNPVNLNIPLALIIDEGSASASEIVSGSLQDLDRAVIVGNTSYGKGLVQRTFDLKYGSKIKLTISKYYTPSGRCVQRLEYYDRENGEKPKEIADSLLKQFKTANGRTVIDGRGIEPDVVVDEIDYSRLTATLVTSNILFDYATKYAKIHNTLPEPRNWNLTQEEYNDFVNYVLQQDFTYSTASELELEKMKKIAEKEGVYDNIKDEYSALLTKVTPSKQQDLNKYQDEIKDLLENEIVSRYYYQTGRAEHNFQHDRDIKKAVEILQNNSEYNSILHN